MTKKRIGIIVFLLFSFFLLQEVSASGVNVELSMGEEAITSGNKFRVKMKVSSGEVFKKFEGFLSYDDEHIQYISADDGISGGGGKIRINIENLTEEEYVEEYPEDYGVGEENPEAEETKKEFELIFKALKPGKTSLAFLDGLAVFSEKDEKMSLSHNRLDIQIKGEKDASSISTLVDLKVVDGELFPSFSKRIKNYKITVKEKTEKLLLSAVPTDDRASIVVKGNGEFQIGENLVQVIVTAEDGSETVYEILVNREKEKKEILNENNEKSPTSILSHSEEKGEKEENRVSSQVEKGKKEKENRKKTLFYVIMGAVGLFTFVLLKIALRALKKLEENEKNEK